MDTVTAMAIDPNSPAKVYASIYNAGVFKTIDGGMNWTAVNSGLAAGTANSLAVNPSSDVYAANNEGVFKSADGGLSWAIRDVGLTDVPVSALAIDLTSPATIYAGSGAGFFKSTN